MFVERKSRANHPSVSNSKFRTLPTLVLLTGHLRRRAKTMSKAKAFIGLSEISVNVGEPLGSHTHTQHSLSLSDSSIWHRDES